MSSVSSSFRFHKHWVALIVLLTLSRSSESRRSPKKKAGIAVAPYIAGGVDAPIGRFPYSCALFSEREFKCAGTLIDRHWVLTVAHCVNPDVADSAYNGVIYCGAHNNITAFDTSQVTSGVRTFIHPRFDGNVEHGYDIALIQLREPFNLPVPKLDLKLYCDFQPGQQFSALGWGYGRKSTGSPAETLQHAEFLEFISRNKCNQKQLYNGIIQPHQICATGSQDTCRGNALCPGMTVNGLFAGDSGGGLLIPHRVKGVINDGKPANDTVVGVVSFGPEKCGVSKGPGVYTAISPFTKWIIRTIRSHRIKKV